MSNFDDIKLREPGAAAREIMEVVDVIEKLPREEMVKVLDTFQGFCMGYFIEHGKFPGAGRAAEFIDQMALLAKGVRKIQGVKIQ